MTKSEKKKSKKAPEALQDDLGRKKWDLEYYKKLHEEKKALLVKEKTEGNSEAEDILSKIPGLGHLLAKGGAPGSGGKDKAKPGKPVQREALKARTEDLAIDSMLHQRKLVTDSTSRKEQGGYWCETCECLLKDSISYLDHINGKKHNRNLGMNMRVVRSSVDDVQSTLEALKRKREQHGGGEADQRSPEDLVDERLRELEREEQVKEEVKAQAEERKRRRKEKKKEKKMKRQEAQKEEEGEGEEEEDQDVEEGEGQENAMGVDPELAKLMGFSGFK